MASEREERLALNEALFRTANERAAAWQERQQDDRETEHYYCECADPECRQTVELRRTEYERVRSDASHFVVVAGHEIPDIEEVVEATDAWAVIEKAPETRVIVEATDPRKR